MFEEMGNWWAVKDGDERAFSIMKRHYSFYHYRDNRRRYGYRNRFQIVGPGKKLLLITPKLDALFIWRIFKDDSGQTGINCGAFRNEGPVLSSELILEAERLALVKWPEQVRFYTYVNSRKVRSHVYAGKCFRKAGWVYCGHTKVNDLLIFGKCSHLVTLKG